jgi:hypothetical protein
VLEAKARFGGSVESVCVRVAPDGDDGLYIDLGDAAWRAIRVTSAGWEIVSDVPVNFIRAAGAAELPEPIAGASLDDLRTFVNITDEDWPLLKAFLRGCLNPRGPYPLLSLNGEQGSAKSTTAKMIRSIVDPRTPDLRAEPRETRDLAIAARGAWLVAFDNISNLPPWLSDALCRLATGGGFATRELYTNFDEALFEATRPVVLTGITDYVVRDDLLDRTIRVTLSAIPEHRRRSERDLWAAFNQARPRLLGALLDDVAAALRTLPSVQLQHLPRMADFALWAVAAERGRGEPVVFMDAFDTARVAGHELAIEASPIGATLVTFVAHDLAREPWQGTATDLLARLVTLGGEAATRQKGWPTSAQRLSGMLRTLAAALRATGVTISFGDRTGKKRNRLIRITCNDTPQPTDGVPGSSAASASGARQDETPAPQADAAALQADAWAVAADDGADGLAGEADGADTCVAVMSVGVGDAHLDGWGEV